MPETREPFHVLAGEPVPVTDLDGIYTLMCELGIVVTRGYRCVLYAWAESEGRWTWRPVAGASTGRGVDPSRAAKSLIAKAGATGKAGLYHVERNPTRSMVKYEIDAVAVFPFTIRTNAEERRFVLYLDVLAGETLDEDRVEQLGKVLESLLSLGGGAIAALLEVERDRSRRRAVDDRLRGDYSSIIGRSEPIQQVLELIDRIAPTNFPVLVLGETGTGKELVARSLHENGQRPDGPFEALNCAMLPEKLAESMLFGHVKGAFTDANSDHRGVFELASGGTLFLDEVAELTPEHQAKLLRVLDEGQVRPIGSESDRAVDVRVVSATNRDLLELVEAGRFRSDLYHRISSVAIELPPLRERREDIPALVRHFLQERGKRITPGALARLTTADWAGNIRELRGKVRVLSELAPGDTVDVAEVDFLRLGGEDTPVDWNEALRRRERDFLVRLITEGPATTVEDTARLVGKSRSWLYEKARDYGIKVTELLRAKAGEASGS